MIHSFSARGHGFQQSKAGHTPLTSHGAAAESQNLPGLGFGKPGEVAKFHQFGQVRRFDGEHLERRATASTVSLSGHNAAAGSAGSTRCMPPPFANALLRRAWSISRCRITRLMSLT
jgi:hypothetical protein